MAATPSENSIAGRKITGWTLPVSSLDDKPKMTAAALKAAFDSNANQMKPALNGLIDDLLSTDGAGNIGTRAINGVSGTTVQAMLEALKALIDLRETTANVDSKLDTKADKTTVAGVVKSISFNAKSGVFTIIEQGGTVHTIDTVLEKVPMACRLDGQDFVLTLEDGAEQRVSLAAFLTPNEFTDSSVIRFSVVGSTVTADIKPGSITLGMLENTLYNQLAALKNAAETAAANAAASAENAGRHKADAAASQTAAVASASEAAGQATLAKSWATGGTGLRPGENEDNSRFYAGMAADAAAVAGRQAADASRSAADAAASVGQAAAEAQRASDEADRAKNEADRAKEIVGGDYVTSGELTKHETSATAHRNIQQKIDNITTSIGQPNGIAPLDGHYLIPAEHIPLPVCVGVTSRGNGSLTDGIDFGMYVEKDGRVVIVGNPEFGGVELYNGVRFLDECLDMSYVGRIVNLLEPIDPGDAATMQAVYDTVNSRLPQVFTVTIPVTNADVTGSVAGTFPACTADETTCIVDAAPTSASWDAFYDCNFRLKTISPTGFTYTVDSNLTSAMTVYITVQDITPFDMTPEGGA